MKFTFLFLNLAKIHIFIPKKNYCFPYHSNLFKLPKQHIDTAYQSNPLKPKRCSIHHPPGVHRSIATLRPFTFECHIMYISVAWHLQGASKKTSFSENWAWQILLLIMRNPPSFFLTNAGDSFCSPWYPSSCGTPSQERIAETD